MDHVFLMDVKTRDGKVTGIEGGHCQHGGKLPTEYNRNEPFRPYLGPIERQALGCEERDAIIGHVDLGQIKAVNKTYYPKD